MWRVGEKLGTLLKIVRLTSTHSYGQLTRFHVELDFMKKLVVAFKAHGVIFPP